MDTNKDHQIQIRVSKEDKVRLKALAKVQNKDLSSYILDLALPSPMKEFQVLVKSLKTSKLLKSSLAELNDFFSRLSLEELKNAVRYKFEAELDEFDSNYVCAMIELACYKKNIPSPAWTKEIKPLENPFFGSELRSLRMYLLKNSLPQFKARNIFIDSSIGDRV